MNLLMPFSDCYAVMSVLRAVNALLLKDIEQFIEISLEDANIRY